MDGFVFGTYEPIFRLNAFIKTMTSPNAFTINNASFSISFSGSTLIAAVLAAGFFSAALVYTSLKACLPKKQKVFLLDFSVFNPPASWSFARSNIRKTLELYNQTDSRCNTVKLTEEDIIFQERIAYRTGLGDNTAVPPAMQSGDNSKCNTEAARFEFETCCLSTVKDLLAKTGVAPSEINFVITNSSLFNPTPSLSATIMNALKLGSRTVNYSLGGMGCSAGVIALDLARELLLLHPNTVALVVSHENITKAFYTGGDRSMMVSNCLFRANGSAVLLTNRPRDAARSKYSIATILRTNMAADDTAFNCVQQTEDDQGNMGVRLTKELIQVGARALRQNLTALGPQVLPWSEKLAFAASLGICKAAKLCKPLAAVLPRSLQNQYTPDFKKAFDFFCIHTGGCGIIDGLEKEMRLSRHQVEPSRASLYRFGNTSSTSVWYELAFIESRYGVSAGQKVWQAAFGSGFKFNSAVLHANRTITDQSHAAWEGFNTAAMWADLDKLEAEAAAARTAKAAAAAAAAAAPAVADLPDAVKPDVAGQFDQALGKPSCTNSPGKHVNAMSTPAWQCKKGN